MQHKKHIYKKNKTATNNNIIDELLKQAKSLVTAKSKIELFDIACFITYAFQNAKGHEIKNILVPEREGARAVPNELLWNTLNNEIIAKLVYDILKFENEQKSILSIKQRSELKKLKENEESYSKEEFLKKFNDTIDLYRTEQKELKEKLEDGNINEKKQ